MKITTPIRIAVADDHALFIDGLKTMLKKIKDPPLALIAEARNGKEIVELADKTNLDIVLMDIQMPEMDGIEATRRIKQRHPEVKVIALSTFDEMSTVHDILDAGADAYLLKNVDKDTFCEAVTTVIKGGTYFSQDAQIKSAVEMYRVNEGTPLILKGELTEREVEILTLICQQYGNKEIAATLHIGIRTVETYRERIMKKTRSANMAGMVIYALKNKIYKQS